MLGIHGRRWNHRCQTLVDVVLTSTLELPLIHRHKPVVMPIHDLRWFERPETGPQLQSLLQSEPVAAVVAAWPDPFAILCRMAPERTESFFMVPFIMDPPPADHELGNPAIARTLLYTSSNGREKNHEALIRALGMLKRRGVARIRVFCTGPLVSARTAVLQRLIVEEGVQDWILFLGWVPRGFVHWLYEHVAGVITTSTYEAMSGTVMEGWQHGKPVACSRIPSIQAMTDLLGVEVRFFDQNDPEDVARGIEDLLADPDRYGRASLRARACLSRVTQERTALQYRDILAWACGKASKPSWHPYQRWWDGGS
jgi:glycosyltransferase involved in cell wall biosynthesis